MIRLLYGYSIAKELLHTTIASVPPKKSKRRKAADGDEDMDSDDDASDPESWNADAQFTNANYQAKKMVFLLFINREWLFRFWELKSMLMVFASQIV